MFYSGYTFRDNGVSVFPFKKLKFRWQDVIRVMTLAYSPGYKTTIKYEDKHGKVRSINISWNIMFKLGSVGLARYCRALDFISSNIQPEKTCFLTKELANCNKYPERYTPEIEAHQAWIKADFRKAEKLCERILKNSPDNVTALKVLGLVKWRYDFEDKDNAVQTLLEKSLQENNPDFYTLVTLIKILMLKSAAPEKIEHYLDIFRSSVGYVYIPIEFLRLSFLLNNRNVSEAKELLDNLEEPVKASGYSDYMEMFGEYKEHILGGKALKLDYILVV
jgi:hypothetical protein